MMPETIFDLWRLYDRRGGVDSASVRRFVGKGASKKVRAMQVRFNEESRTPVWRRMVKGFSLPSSDDWRKVKCPVYLLVAAEDTVCPVSETEKIYGWLGGETKKDVEKAVIPSAGHSLIFEAPQVTSKLVGEFLKTHVREELDLGWQLSYLKEDKWMLKNLTKWTNFVPVGDRVGNSRFRPMKVRLRRG
jgi:pimeloyl-ACP methyl ester carboxylesterase